MSGMRQLSMSIFSLSRCCGSLVYSKMYGQDDNGE